MSRSEVEQTGWQYFEENGNGSWQPENSRGEVRVVMSTRSDVHMQIIAAGLAAESGQTVCGVRDIPPREWTVTPAEAIKLLGKTVSKILEETEPTAGSEPRLS